MHTQRCSEKFPNKHETLTQCWADVEDGGPISKQHWVSVSVCWVGIISRAAAVWFTVWFDNSQRLSSARRIRNNVDFVGFWDVPFFARYPKWCQRRTPTNARRWPNVGLLLAHRLRRWPNINPTLIQRIMFAGTLILGKNGTSSTAGVAAALIVEVTQSSWYQWRPVFMRQPQKQPERY